MGGDARDGSRPDSADRSQILGAGERGRSGWCRGRGFAMGDDGPRGDFADARQGGEFPPGRGVGIDPGAYLGGAGGDVTGWRRRDAGGSRQVERPPHQGKANGEHHRRAVRTPRRRCRGRVLHKHKRGVRSGPQRKEPRSFSPRGPQPTPIHKPFANSVAKDSNDPRRASTDPSRPFGCRTRKLVQGRKD
jgi:hypothetical protein